MPTQGPTDLLPHARTLHQQGHRIALLDSPPDTSAARYAHLCLLDAPHLDEPPPGHGEHVCLATFDHGLARHGIRSRHEPDLGFTLATYPIKARATLDRHTGTLHQTGTKALLDEPPTPPGEPLHATGLELTHTPHAFTRMVQRARAYIQAGHTYQVNLSLRATTHLTGDPTRLFDTLRTINPSPYQALLATPEATLVSASPELLLDTHHDTLTTRPIAGTRPRSNDPHEDAQLEQALLADAKERAEHAMLVDLARNDLGRIARYGTVNVTDDAIIERYSHVMHLVSEVQAKRHPDATPWDAFQAIFPCGTISGAPKHRSLEIIDELEPVSRGAYTGSLGIITPEWSTWNILIRTLILQGEKAHVQAGAGIVADSDPQREHAESLDKAQALLDALKIPRPHTTPTAPPRNA